MIPCVLAQEEHSCRCCCAARARSASKPSSSAARTADSHVAFPHCLNMAFASLLSCVRVQPSEVASAVGNRGVRVIAQSTASAAAFGGSMPRSTSTCVKSSTNCPWPLRGETQGDDAKQKQHALTTQDVASAATMPWLDNQVCLVYCSASGAVHAHAKYCSPFPVVWLIQQENPLVSGCQATDLSQNRPEQHAPNTTATHFQVQLSVLSAWSQICWLLANARQHR